jgi:hypothetical protein
MALNTCDTVFTADGACPGHLGKFDSCLAEYLYEISSDGADDTTGNVDAFGYYAYFDFSSPGPGDGDCDNGTVIKVPAKHFILSEDPSGLVRLQTFDSEDEALNEFHQHVTRFQDWIDNDH